MKETCSPFKDALVIRLSLLTAAIPLLLALAALGQSNHPRGHVDRIAEDVAIAFDRGAEMNADAKREWQMLVVGEVGRPPLELYCGLRGAIGCREDEHCFIAEGLDQAAAVPAGALTGEAQAPGDHRQGLGIAQLFV